MSRNLIALACSTLLLLPSFAAAQKASSDAPSSKKEAVVLKPIVDRITPQAIPEPAPVPNFASRVVVQNRPKVHDDGSRSNEQRMIFAGPQLVNQYPDLPIRRPRNLLSPFGAQGGFVPLGDDPVFPRGDGGEGGGGSMTSIQLCSQDIDLTVLATEIQYGPDPVPVRMDYCIGGEGSCDDSGATFLPTFGGEDLVVDTSIPIESFNFTAGQTDQELVLKGRFAYPNWEDPWLEASYLSSDQNNFLILQNGENLEAALIAKGFGEPMYAQQSVAQILENFELIDLEGNLVLEEDQVVVFGELGQVWSGDVQDIGVLVDLNCPVQSEVVLRDSIGIDNTTTNNNYPFHSSSLTSGNWLNTGAVNVQANQNLTLTQVRTIAGLMSFNHNFSAVDYKVNIWSSQQMVIDFPTQGNIASITLSEPVTGPSLFGTTHFQASLSGTANTYEFVFDISPWQIQMSAGQNYFIGVQFLTPGGSGGPGIFGVQETNELGNSDMQMGSSMSGGWRYVETSTLSLWSGRLAYDVRGTSN